MEYKQYYSDTFGEELSEKETKLIDEIMKMYFTNRDWRNRGSTIC